LTQEHAEKHCHWCGGEVGLREWKDGKRVYCSSDCHSAGLLPVFVLIIVVFTPIFIIDLALSGFILSLFVSRYSGFPIFGYGAYIAIIVTEIIGILFGYQGWKVRKRVPKA